MKQSLIIMLVVVFAAMVGFVQFCPQLIPAEWQRHLRWIGWIGTVLSVLAAIAQLSGYNLRTVFNAKRTARKHLLGEIQDNMSLAERLVSGKEVITPTKFATSVWTSVRGEAEGWMTTSVYASLEEGYRRMRDVNARVDYINANPTVRTTDRKIYRDTFLRHSGDILHGLKEARDCLVDS